ncbi:MAG: hypothetical protein ACI362_03560 [Coriobacteriales bacterium]
MKTKKNDGLSSVSAYSKQNASRPTRVFNTAGLALAGTALLGMTVAFSTAGIPVTTASADDAQATPQEQGQSTTSSLAYSSGKAATQKSETVYVFQKADGSVKNQTVSNSLTNGNGAQLLQDQTDLTDIENVEGDQEFTQSSEGTVWDAKGSDISYRGTTTKEAPVDIKVSYQLDGKDVTPDEISGKTGHVKIHIAYTNNSKQTVDGQTVYTPFLAMTGLILDNDNFTNVTTDNAKVIDDGDRHLIAGYAMPGLKESLGLDDSIDLDIPSSVDIEADATDFSLDSMLTLVSSDFFGDVDVDNLNAGNIQDQLNQMQDAMNQLIDGGATLTDGLQQLSTGASSLKDGATQVDEGAATLSDKLGDAKAGSAQLKSGTEQLVAGVGELSGKTGGFSTAINGANQLAAGSSQLESGLNKAIGGVQLIANGNGTAQNPGIAGIAAQLSASNDQAAQQLGKDKQAVSTAAGDLKKDLGQLQTDNTNLVASLTDIMNSTTDATTKAKLKGVLDELGNSTTASKLATHAGDLETALGTLDTDTTNTLTAAQTGAQKAAAGLNQYVSALNNQVIGTASTQSSAGTGLTSAVEGAQALNAGATQLSTGLTNASQQLGAGAKQLSDGATQLNDGTGQLDQGLAALLAGSKTLAGGTAQLSDGASQLADGAQQAADGSVQLSDGLQQFNEQAVQKIVDAFSGNLGSLADKTKAIVQAGKNYNNFCGITSGTEGHVKFIYETDAINKD